MGQQSISMSDPRYEREFGRFLPGKVCVGTSVEDAVGAIRKAFDIPETDLADALMPDERDWRKLTPRQRLAAIRQLADRRMRGRG